MEGAEHLKTRIALGPPLDKFNFILLLIEIKSSFGGIIQFHKFHRIHYFVAYVYRTFVREQKNLLRHVTN